MLNIMEQVENGKAVLFLEGRLDTLTAPDLENAIRNLLPGLSGLTFDFAKLEYVSSAGLRVLLMAQKAMSGRGEMTICHVNEIIAEIFEVTGFSDILTVV